MTGPRIIQPDPAESQPIAEVIAASFEDLGVSRWLVADEKARRSVLAANFRIWVSHAFGHGAVYATEDLSGAAVWLDATSGAIPLPYQYDGLLLSQCGRYAPRFLVLDDAFDSAAPAMPRHHLAFLAVHPTRQGEGIGAALLDRHHSLLDVLGLPASLDASSEAAARLYRRLGYEGEEPVFLPDAGPPFWPMVRPPQPLPAPG
ncbi:GNAT family N-acetyltransferase [Plantactinospora sp. CA-290183]|uniref:GNAT family N-acetyltransferase n=1 Tax=Plantactinospora sp. CA-290183 TaxID=3240006 RepID=UPI003D90C15D